MVDDYTGFQMMVLFPLPAGMRDLSKDYIDNILSRIPTDNEDPIFIR